MKGTRRLLAFALALCMLAASALAAAFADEVSGGGSAAQSAGVSSGGGGATAIAGGGGVSSEAAAAGGGGAGSGGGMAPENPVDRFVAAQKALLDEPSIEYWPASRWWMAEGLHTDETIVAGVKELYEMGIGGIEIVCRNGGVRLPDDLDMGGAYGWSGDTTAANVYSWGSEEWNHDSALVIEEATKYGMGFSLTSGTNWGNANLPREYLKPDDDGAGKSLGYKIQVVEGGQGFNGVLPRSFIAAPGNAIRDLLEPDEFVIRQDLVAVVAMKRDPSSDATLADGNNAGTILMNNAHPDRFMVYDDDKTVVLTDQVTLGGAPVTKETMADPTGAAEFRLNWTPPDDGVWDVYCFWVQGTGQSPTPSADVNFTINYIDPAGSEAFLDYYENVFFSEELKEIVRANGRGEMYMDSLEISTTNGQTGQFWGLTLMDEFYARHGYDLSRYLPYIVRTGGRAEFTKWHARMLDSDGVLEQKIRSDLYDVMTNCYIENVLLPLKNWLNSHMNMKLRAEIAYNLPYEMSLSGRGVDYVETESLDFGEELESFRVFAGSANIYGKRFSSETGALSGQNYAHGMERYMRLINTQFAGGIQHTVWHGYSSLSGPVPEDDGVWTSNYWPGGEVMSDSWSQRLGPRQPAYGHYGDLMTKISRDQAILQQGAARIDLAILKTDYHNTHNYNQGATDIGYTRNRKALFMKDLALQDAGYTYNYFAPENLEKLEQEGIADYRPGEGMIPDTAGYQAAIVYQENMRVESAQKLLELAREGLPVVIVNGLIERSMTTRGTNSWGRPIGPSSPVAEGYPSVVTTNRYHREAAAYTLGNDGREAELVAVMAELKALGNVVELDPEGLPTDPVSPDPEAWGYEEENYYNKTGILQALQSLGVRPRAQFQEPSKNYLTAMRETDDALYLWVYNFMTDDEFKKQMAEFPIVDDISISVDAVGKPYAIDTWTGGIEELAAYAAADGRTSLGLSLSPGETTVIAIDLAASGDATHAIATEADSSFLADGKVYLRASEGGVYETTLSDGSVEVTGIAGTADILLPEWDLAVEDWTRGELTVLTEGRGNGYTTKESYYETKKTPIEVGKTALVPWKDIPAVGPAVSGVGTYTTAFELPADWGADNGAFFSVDSLCRNTAYVWVNGQRAVGFDFVAGTVDVSGLLKPGANEIKVEVASTLRNRMIDLGYRGVNQDSEYLPDGPLSENGNRVSIKMPVADYGMVGEAKLVTYTVAEAVTATTPQQPPQQPSTPPASGLPSGAGTIVPSGGSDAAADQDGSATDGPATDDPVTDDPADGVLDGDGQADSGETPGPGAIAWENPFSDVAESDWHYDAVGYVYANGLMLGVSQESPAFNPDGTVTRSAFVTTLWRLAGEPVPAEGGEATAFSDVASDAWHAKAIAWAASSGIVLGVGDGAFLPDEAVTRQDMCVIFMRYLTAAGSAPANVRAYEAFADEAGIAGYALDSVKAMFESGTVSGKPGNLFDPLGTATRAELATILSRLAQ